MTQKSNIKQPNEQWFSNIPELETRQLLLSVMISHKPLRRRIFQTSQHLESIATIKDIGVASYILGLYWKREREILYKYWHDKLRQYNGSDKLFNEMFGCLRNVYYNMYKKCGSKNPVRFKENDIEREYT